VTYRYICPLHDDDQLLMSESSSLNAARVVVVDLASLPVENTKSRELAMESATGGKRRFGDWPTKVFDATQQGARSNEETSKPVHSVLRRLERN
jgi:hypothetical protein